MSRFGARRYPWIWVAVLPLASLVVVRLLGAERGFPLVPLVAYTPHLAVAFLLLAGVGLALRNWAAATAAAIGCACVLALVLPRVFGEAEQPHPGGVELRVLSTNIHHGTTDAEALLAMVEERDADLLSVQELTPSFARLLERRGIGRLLPNAVLSVRRGSSGGGLYSRLPLRRLPAPPPVAFRMPRALAVLPGGRAVRVVAVHPFPPLRTGIDDWIGGLESLPRAEPGPPWLLVGDFNATLDHAELRELIASGYRDAATVTGSALIPTWPSGRVFPPEVTIDHVLADERIRILEFAIEDLPGSDHRAVFARLSVP